MRRLTEEWLIDELPPESAQVNVRPIQPGDASLINEMHQRLSPETIHSRFQGPRIPTLDVVERICRTTSASGAGFVATVQGEADVVVALAYYERVAQEREAIAEVGIVVADQFQGQGIGRRLWQDLHSHAQANEIRELSVLFDPSNLRVLRLLRGSGFAYQSKGNWSLRECLVSVGDHIGPTRRERTFHALP